MTDSKVTQFSADTTPTLDDLLMTINDPAGTPGNKKVTLANLIKILSQHLTIENQEITSNAQLVDQKMQRGWSFITGTNPWTQKSVTITLPVAFDDANYDVIPSVLGYKASDPTARSDVAGPAGNVYGFQVQILSVSQFTVTITAAAAEANTNRILFDWIAIGNKA